MRLDTLFKRAGRYLVPCALRSVYYAVKCKALISLRADIQLSPYIRFGAGTDIRPYSRIITSSGPITFGRGCGLNCFSYIAAGKAPITIGDHVRIGSHVSIIATNKLFDDPTKLIVEQGTSEKGITIEDDVWIGSHSVIVDGVRIGKGSVIGAGAIVTRDIPPMSVAVGNPARVIRKRGEPAPRKDRVEIVG